MMTYTEDLELREQALVKALYPYIKKVGKKGKLTKFSLTFDVIKVDANTIDFLSVNLVELPKVK